VLADAQELADVDAEKDGDRPGRAAPSDRVPLPALDPADRARVNTQEIRHRMHGQAALGTDTADAESDERAEIERHLLMTGAVAGPIQVVVQRGQVGERGAARADAEPGSSWPDPWCGLMFTLIAGCGEFYVGTGIVAEKIQMGFQQREPVERVAARALTGIGLS
jgi:hypothetical protein